MASTHKVKLIEKKELARETFGFYFEKPEGFRFKAGQSVRLTLLDPPETDEEGNTRLFTVAGAPCEDRLLIASRSRNTAFKRVLKSLSPGSLVEIRGPFGNFLLHEDASKPAVFLAGGIGITPFRSMLVQADNEKLTHDFTLFYSNRNPEDATFLEELNRLKSGSLNLTIVPIITTKEGHLTTETIRKHLPDLLAPIYYLVGPPAMVGGARMLLESLQIPENQIRFEEFEGYGAKVAS